MVMPLTFNSSHASAFFAAPSSRPQPNPTLFSTHSLSVAFRSGVLSSFGSFLICPFPPPAPLHCCPSRACSLRPEPSLEMSGPLPAPPLLHQLDLSVRHRRDVAGYAHPPVSVSVPGSALVTVPM
eukprot:4719394-Pleurochrysis_carterae.AAC.1